MALTASAELIGGRYEIVAPISEGAMGAVYRARDRASDDNDVAVKRLVDIASWPASRSRRACWRDCAIRASSGCSTT